MQDCDDCDLNEECSITPGEASCLKDAEKDYQANNITYCLNDFAWFRDVYDLLSQVRFRQLYFLRRSPDDMMYDDMITALTTQAPDDQVVKIEDSIYKLTIHHHDLVLLEGVLPETEEKVS